MSLVVLETVVVDVVVDVDVVVLSVVDVDTVVVVEVVVDVDVVVVVVTVVVEIVVVVVVDFSVLKKSPRKGKSCVDPDPVEEAPSEEDAVLVITASSPASLVVELRMLLSMSNQVKSWFVPLLEVEASSRLSVVLSYKAGFIERDSSETTEPLLRIIEGISLSISNGNSKSKH